MVNTRAATALVVLIAAAAALAVLFVMPGYATLVGNTYNEGNSSDVKYITIALDENQYSGAVTSEIKYHTLTEIGDGGRIIQYVPEYEETITVSEIHTVKSVNDTIYTVAGGTYDGVKFIVTDNEHNYVTIIDQNGGTVAIDTVLTYNAVDYTVKSVNDTIYTVNGGTYNGVKFIVTDEEHNYVTVIDQNGNTVAIDTELTCNRDRNVTEVVVFNISLDASDVIPTYNLHISVDDQNKMTGTFFIKYTVGVVSTNVAFPPSTGITINSLNASSMTITMYVHSAEIRPGDEPAPPLNDVSFIFRAEVPSS